MIRSPWKRFLSLDQDLSNVPVAAPLVRSAIEQIQVVDRAATLTTLMYDTLATDGRSGAEPAT
jgi:hypothetical protein